MCAPIAQVLSLFELARAEAYMEAGSEEAQSKALMILEEVYIKAGYFIFHLSLLNTCIDIAEKNTLQSTFAGICKKILCNQLVQASVLQLCLRGIKSKLSDTHDPEQDIVPLTVCFSCGIFNE